MRPMSEFKKSRAAATVLAVVLTLAGCAEVAPGEPGPSDPGEVAPTSPVSWDDEFDFGVPGEVLETHADVRFYPACGNEVMDWDGVRYYQYRPSRIHDFPDHAGVVTGASAVENLPTLTWARMGSPLPAIPMPEPGDDTGTLVIYQGGHAYWESDNGALWAWMTTTKLEYNWVC